MLTESGVDIMESFILVTCAKWLGVVSARGGAACRGGGGGSEEGGWDGTRKQEGGHTRGLVAYVEVFKFYYKQKAGNP